MYVMTMVILDIEDAIAFAASCCHTGGISTMRARHDACTAFNTKSRIHKSTIAMILCSKVSDESDPFQN
jgi:hypothetical protein